MHIGIYRVQYLHHVDQMETMTKDSVFSFATSTIVITEVQRFLRLLCQEITMLNSDRPCLRLSLTNVSTGTQKPLFGFIWLSLKTV